MSSNKVVITVSEELKSVVPPFLEKRKIELPVLRTALKTGDFGTLETLGHRLRGNAGGYGFNRMGSLGAEIEAASKTKDSQKIETVIDELEQYLSNIEVVYVAAG